MKKYKAEYGIDFDTLSASSAYSNQSMDDLERKIAEMIISNRKKKGYSDESSPDGIPQKIMELPEEEESPTYYSDFSVEPNAAKAGDNFGNMTRKEEEMERNDLKNSHKKGTTKKKPATSVSLAKNNLRDMVTEEIQIHNTPFPQRNNSNENLQDVQDPNNQGTAQQVFMFGNNNQRMNSKKIILFCYLL